MVFLTSQMLLSTVGYNSLLKVNLLVAVRKVHKSVDFNTLTTFIMSQIGLPLKKECIDLLFIV